MISLTALTFASWAAVIALFTVYRSIPTGVLADGTSPDFAGRSFLSDDFFALPLLVPFTSDERGTSLI